MGQLVSEIRAAERAAAKPRRRPLHPPRAPQLPTRHSSRLRAAEPPVRAAAAATALSVALRSPLSPLRLLALARLRHPLPLVPSPVASSPPPNPAQAAVPESTWFM